MMTRKRSRVADEALQAAEEPANLISILPLVLANQDGMLLRFPSKRCLRLTCKASKAAVDPTLHAVCIPNSEDIVSNNDLFNAFRRSPLTLAATKIYSQDCITKECMNKLSGVQFKHVQDAFLSINSSALDLLACRWKFGSELKVLNLTVFWHYNTHPPSQFDSAWKKFSKVKWPLLESLILDIEPVVDDAASSDEDADDESNYPDPDMGEVVCLLSYFPSLKHLQLKNYLTLADTKAIAAVPHEKLERAEFMFFSELDIDRPESGCTAALAGAKWPMLQDLKHTIRSISKDDVSALLKASWFNNLKKLHLVCPGLRLEVAKELFVGLQFGALETLQHNLEFDALVIFKQPMEFPRLKNLSIDVFGRPEEDNSTGNPFNVGLSSFFSNTKLPSLESLTIGSSSYRSHNGLRPWNMPPSFANNTVEPARVLPALKRLVMKRLLISQDCSAFLGLFYLRGDCAVDLHGCKVESSLDSPAFAEILTLFSLQRYAFDTKLRCLKLYEKAVWYGLVSFDTLKSIAASMYLSNLTDQVNSLLEPVTACVALAGAAQETSVEGSLLQRSHKGTLEAISGLHRVCAAVNNGGPSGDGGGGDGSQ